MPLLLFIFVIVAFPVYAPILMINEIIEGVLGVKNVKIYLAIICLVFTVLIAILKNIKKNHIATILNVLNIVAGYILIKGLFLDFIPGGSPISTLSLEFTEKMMPLLTGSFTGFVLGLFMYLITLTLYFVDLILPVLIMLAIQKFINTIISKHKVRFFRSKHRV